MCRPEGQKWCRVVSRLRPSFPELWCGRGGHVLDTVTIASIIYHFWLRLHSLHQQFARFRLAKQMPPLLPQVLVDRLALGVGHATVPSISAHFASRSFTRWPYTFASAA